MTQQHPPMPQPPPSYYPDQHGVSRWWDGLRWTDHVQPAAVPQFVPQPAVPQQVIYTQRVSADGHVSDLTTGGHIVNGILTLCTFGLWARVWFLMWWLERRRIR